MQHSLSQPSAPGIRRIAEHLSLMAVQLRDGAHVHHPAKHLDEHAAYLSRQADLLTAFLKLTELEMSQVADKIHELRTKLSAAQLDAARGRQAQKTLDTLTSAGKIMDDADLSALSEPDPVLDEGTETPATLNP